MGRYRRARRVNAGNTRIRRDAGCSQPRMGRYRRARRVNAGNTRIRRDAGCSQHRMGRYRRARRVNVEPGVSTPGMRHEPSPLSSSSPGRATPTGAGAYTISPRGSSDDVGRGGDATQPPAHAAGYAVSPRRAIGNCQVRRSRLLPLGHTPSPRRGSVPRCAVYSLGSSRAWRCRPFSTLRASPDFRRHRNRHAEARVESDCLAPRN